MPNLMACALHLRDQLNIRSLKQLTKKKTCPGIDQCPRTHPLSFVRGWAAGLSRGSLSAGQVSGALVQDTAAVCYREKNVRVQRNPMLSDAH